MSGSSLLDPCISSNWGHLRGLRARYFTVLRRFLTASMKRHLLVYHWFLSAVALAKGSHHTSLRCCFRSSGHWVVLRSFAWGMLFYQSSNNPSYRAIALHDIQPFLIPIILYFSAVDSLRIAISQF